MAKAIGYLVTNKALLYTFLENADVPLDNNRAESAIRPFVVGRKNWLFSDSVKGAKASAVIYSIVSTAAANGLNVEQYITQLLTAENRRCPGNFIFLKDRFGGPFYLPDAYRYCALTIQKNSGLFVAHRVEGIQTFFV